MRNLLTACVACGLLIASAQDSAAATHRKHRKTAKQSSTTTAKSQEGSGATANVGTKGFPPKPLPSADPRNPADPQRSAVDKRVTSSDNPVKPPDPTQPTKK